MYTLVSFASHMPCATLDVSSFQRALTSPLGKNLLTNAQARLVLGNQLHPPYVPANDMQLPSAIGSPASYCPVPVVQGHNNHLPVKHIFYTLTLFSNGSFNIDSLHLVG